MKELPKNLVLMVLLIISISFLVSAVYAAGSTTAQKNFVYGGYSKDYVYAVKSTSENIIYFLYNPTNAVLWDYKIDQYISAVAISPDGMYVAVGSGGGPLYFFDQKGNLIWKKQFGTSGIWSIQFSEDGNYIYVSNLGQGFYINRNGNREDRPTSSAVAATPSTTILSRSQASSPTITQTLIPTDNLPVKTETTDFFGISFFGGA